MDIERELAAALRAQDPGAAFTATVLQRVEQVPLAAKPRRTWRVPASLAAGVLLLLSSALLIERQLEQRRIAVAGNELALALAITSQQLNDVQRMLSRNEPKENGI